MTEDQVGLSFGESARAKREGEKIREKGIEEKEEEEERYGKYLCMDHYGFCMNTTLSHFLGCS